MSKRSRASKIDKWVKEGRGTGIGADYQPWLKIQDVSSSGRSTRLKGIKTNRQHEFLSDLERNYFYLTEFSDFIVGIREQGDLQTGWNREREAGETIMYAIFSGCHCDQKFIGTKQKRIYI